MKLEFGKVKWFDDAKGYGFVLRTSGEEVFVHFSAIEGDGYRFLYEGQDVQFECVAGPKGLLAKRVTRLKNYANAARTPGESGSVGTLG